jgi:hypothetical protein
MYNVGPTPVKPSQFSIFGFQHLHSSGFRLSRVEEPETQPEIDWKLKTQNPKLKTELS